MKTKWTIAIFCSLTLLAVAAAVVLSKQPKPSAVANGTQQFEVNGVVRGQEDGGKTLLIQHEDIPGFMPAMTMPFSLHGIDGNEFTAGDRVRIALTVTKDDSWISRIEKVGSEIPAVTAAKLSLNDDRLEPGEIVSDFTLTNQDGKEFHLADFRGKAVLVTFIYTRCPLPNYCPLMSKNFAELQERLTKEFAGRFHLVSISFDSDFDTPQVMKSYARAFTKDESTWTFASGNKQQILSVASQFGLIYLPEAGLFSHDLRTALISPDRKLVHIWRSNVWMPDEIENRVAEVLRQKPVLAAVDDQRHLGERRAN